MAVVTGIWNRITVYCMNHNEPVPMSIANNTQLIKTPFYACSNYFPENQDADNPPCPNRLNLDDYQGLVLKLINYISENGPTMDYTNYSFEYRGVRQKISVRVLKYTNSEIRLGILNRSVLR
jgi:hypothetical protein